MGNRAGLELTVTHRTKFSIPSLGDEVFPDLMSRLSLSKQERLGGHGLLHVS